MNCPAPPRIFIAPGDGSAVELLRSADVRDHFRQVALRGGDIGTQGLGPVEGVQVLPPVRSLPLGRSSSQDSVPAAVNGASSTGVERNSSDKRGLDSVEARKRTEPVRGRGVVPALNLGAGKPAPLPSDGALGSWSGDVASASASLDKETGGSLFTAAGISVVARAADDNDGADNERKDSVTPRGDPENGEVFYSVGDGNAPTLALVTAVRVSRAPMDADRTSTGSEPRVPLSLREPSRAEHAGAGVLVRRTIWRSGSAEFLSTAERSLLEAAERAQDGDFAARFASIGQFEVRDERTSAAQAAERSVANLITEARRRTEAAAKRAERRPSMKAVTAPEMAAAGSLIAALPPSGRMGQEVSVADALRVVSDGGKVDQIAHEGGFAGAEDDDGSSPYAPAATVPIELPRPAARHALPPGLGGEISAVPTDGSMLPGSAMVSGVAAQLRTGAFWRTAPELASASPLVASVLLGAQPSDSAPRSSRIPQPLDELAHPTHSDEAGSGSVLPAPEFRREPGSAAPARGAPSGGVDPAFAATQGGTGEQAPGGGRFAATAPAGFGNGRPYQQLPGRQHDQQVSREFLSDVAAGAPLRDDHPSLSAQKVYGPDGWQAPLLAGPVDRDPVSLGGQRVVRPASIALSGLRGAPNARAAVEAPVARRTNTSSTSRFSNLLSPVTLDHGDAGVHPTAAAAAHSVRDTKTVLLPPPTFDIFPGVLDFGGVQVGVQYRMVIRVKNVGVDSSRFRITRRPRRTGAPHEILARFAPGIVAPGMTVDVEVQLLAHAGGVVSGDFVELVSADEVFRVPVTADIVSPAVYDPRSTRAEVVGPIAAPRLR